MGRYASTPRARLGFALENLKSTLIPKKQCQTKAGIFGKKL